MARSDVTVERRPDPDLVGLNLEQRDLLKLVRDYSEREIAPGQPKTKSPAGFPGISEGWRS